MVKVLLCGDVRGRIDQLVARVSKLQSSAHGPFDLLFCVGEFFAPPVSQPTSAGLDELGETRAPAALGGAARRHLHAPAAPGALALSPITPKMKRRGHADP